MSRALRVARSPRILLLAAALVALLAVFLVHDGAPPARASHTLAVPTGVTATPGDGEVVLSWSTVAQANRYRIQYGEQLSGTTAETGTNVTSHTFTASTHGITNGKFYIFRVLANDNSGIHTESGWSDWVTAVPRATAPTTQVSNLGQTDVVPATVTISTGSVSQGFFTGTNSAGYTLSSIEVDVDTALDATAAAKVRAELWSENARGEPSAFLEALEVPPTLSAGVNTLKAPLGTVLAPETGYHIVLYTTASQALVVAGVASNAEDSGAAEGWELNNRRIGLDAANPHSPGGQTWDVVSGGVESLKIAVKGAARAEGSGKPIWSATLNPAEVDTGVFGCERRFTDCSGATVLSNDDFVHKGTSHSVTILRHRNNATDSSRRLSLQVRPLVDAAAFGQMTLHVGGRTFAVADASVSRDTSTPSWSQAVWAGTGMTWAATDTISLQLMIPEASSNNNLSALSATTSTSETGTYSGLTLHFGAAITKYLTTVGNAVTHARLRPTVEDTGKAMVQVGKSGNLADVTSGSASNPIALAVGDNVLIARVTAENGDTQDYTVTIRRQSGNANLSALTAGGGTSATGTFNALTLTPSPFAAGTTAYSVRVDPDITHAKLTPTVADPGMGDETKATVQVGKRGGTLATVTSGQASAAIDLSLGANEIIVRVTAEDTSITKDYVVTINVDGTPPAPAGLTVTPGAHSLDVTWTPPGVTVDGYDVHYTTMSASDLADDAPVGDYEHPRLGRIVNRHPSRGWVTLPKSNTAARYGIGYLNQGQEYRVRVRAYNRHGIGPWAVGAGVPGEAPYTVSLSASAVEVREGDAVTITATVKHNRRPVAIQEDLDVLLSIHLGTAEAGDLGTAERIRIAKYTESGSVTIPTFRDADGDDETFAVLIRWIPSRDKAEVGHPYIVWVTVTEGEPAPTERTVLVPELTATGGDGALQLSWHDTADDAVGYDVQYKLSSARDRRATSTGNPATGWVDAGHTGAERSMTISGLDDGVAYDARVRLVWDDGTSTWSKVASAATDADSGQTSTDSGAQNDPPEQESAALPTAVTLSLDRTTISESAGAVTVTATLDAPAPADGNGVSLGLYPVSGSTAARNSDYTMPDTLVVPAGQRSGTASIAISNDVVDEADETVSVAVFAETGYATLSASAPTLTIVDDDTAGVTVTAASPLAVDEGATATYTVVLDSQPTSDVTITAASGDVDAVTVSPASRVFTATNWNTAQTFTVSGVADSDTNDESVGVSHSVTSADTKYANALVSTVSVSVSDTTTPPPQQQNRAPTVASAIGDITGMSAGDSRDIALSGVFSDADGDSLTYAVESSDQDVAWAYELQGTLTVLAVAGGTATITVTAEDPDGEQVSDQFSVTVAAPQQQNRAPTVASAIGDISDLTAGTTRDVPLSGVFSDLDGDALTITADSSDDAVATVVVSADQSRLTLTGATEGRATITVTAEDADGNRVSDAFEVAVAASQTTLSGIAAQYDANGDGVIDGSEYQQVKEDWLSGKITQAQFLEVVRVHLSSG